HRASYVTTRPSCRNAGFSRCKRLRSSRSTAALYASPMPPMLLQTVCGQPLAGEGDGRGAVRVVARRMHGIPALAPFTDAAAQRVHVGEAEIPHRERRTGARDFVGSIAGEDDLPVARAALRPLRQLLLAP